MIWAVAAYFNPFGCRYRFGNYHLFRRSVPMPLLTIEVTEDGLPGDLRDGDATKLVVVAGDRMWQKERCWNLALQHLPDDCDKIAFVDCDVVLPPDFGVRASLLLDMVPLGQPFQTVDYMLESGARDFSWESQASVFGSKLRQGELVSNGIAWAARRDLIARHGFYDRLILGGADAALAMTAWGTCEAAPDRFLMNAARRDHFVAWARPLAAEVDRVGFCPGVVVRHLWHGSEASRKYHERKKLLADFDPVRDVRALYEGGLVWGDSAAAAALRASADVYFAARAFGN